MKKILSIISASVIVLALSTSCKEFLDINYDPNTPASENISNDMIMPGVEMNLAVSYGNYLRIVGGYFCQHYAHQFGTSNYLDYSQFEQSATRSSSTYSQLFQKVITNASIMEEKAVAAEEWGTNLAAVTLKAFAYQALVDCYGEVPYTQALNDQYLAPEYDEGQVVYEGILAEIDNALEKVSGGETVAQSFLFPGAKASEWVKFANALKLRILMRMADVKDVNKEVKAIIDGGDLPAEDIAFQDCWTEAMGHESPFWGEEFSTLGGSTQINVIANIAIIGTMQVKDAEGNIIYSDPRLPAFFQANGSGKFEGGVSGTNFSNADAPFGTTANWCRPVASYDMPVYLITVSEIEFFIAEYYARTSNASAASEHYAKAVEASFENAGVEGADGFIRQYPYDNANYKKSIGIAKWIALAGINNFEAYCEVRRLNYPAFGTVKGSEIFNGSGAVNSGKYVAGTLYTPYQVFAQVGENKLLERFPYAESSDARNSNCPEFPGYTTPIFWGK